MISLHRLRFAAPMAVLLVALGLLASSATAKPQGPAIGDAHAVAGAAGSGPGKRDLTVMTQNLYLGSSLTPALTATDAASFVAAVAQIYATVLYTNFPARAEAIADEIEAKDPDLIGLQEVTKWTTEGAKRLPDTTSSPSCRATSQAAASTTRWRPSSDNADIGPAPLALVAASNRPRPSPARCGSRIAT